MIEAYGYKASDIPVHNYWINELDRNNIWVAGVYPYGFHIVIYYLHMVFGIKTYVLLRIFGVVQTYFVYLAMVVALKMVCKGRFTPYLGVLFYVMDIFNRNKMCIRDRSETAAFIYDQTGDAVSAKEIAKRLGKAYDMPAEEVQEDVNAVLETFRNYGILERV